MEGLSKNELAATEYVGWGHVGKENNGYFKLIDFAKGDSVVSLKTVDARGSGWLYKMQAQIRELSGGVDVAGQPANVILDIRVQPGGAQAAEQLVQYGERYNVTVIIKEYH